MCASIRKSDSRSGDQVADRLRDEDFIGFGVGGDAGADVDGEAGDLVVVEFTFADVDADSRFEAERSDAVDDRLSRADRACWPVKAREESVAGGVPFVSAVATELSSNYRVVAGEQSRHARSPILAAWSVDATMSVNITVARTLSGTDGASSPATNRSISSAMSGERKRPK